MGAPALLLAWLAVAALATRTAAQAGGLQLLSPSRTKPPRTSFSMPVPGPPLPGLSPVRVAEWYGQPGVGLPVWARCNGSASPAPVPAYPPGPPGRLPKPPLWLPAAFATLEPGRYLLLGRYSGRETMGGGLDTALPAAADPAATELVGEVMASDDGGRTWECVDPAPPPAATDQPRPPGSPEPAPFLPFLARGATTFTVHRDLPSVGGSCAVVCVAGGTPPLPDRQPGSPLLFGPRVADVACSSDGATWLRGASLPSPLEGATHVAAGTGSTLLVGGLRNDGSTHLLLARFPNGTRPVPISRADDYASECVPVGWRTAALAGGGIGQRTRTAATWLPLRQRLLMGGGVLHPMGGASSGGGAMQNSSTSGRDRELPMTDLYEADVMAWIAATEGDETAAGEEGYLPLIRRRALQGATGGNETGAGGGNETGWNGEDSSVVVVTASPNAEPPPSGAATASATRSVQPSVMDNRRPTVVAVSRLQTWLPAVGSTGAASRSLLELVALPVALQPDEALPGRDYIVAALQLRLFAAVYHAGRDDELPYGPEHQLAPLTNRFHGGYRACGLNPAMPAVGDTGMAVMPEVGTAAAAPVMGDTLPPGVVSFGPAWLDGRFPSMLAIDAGTGRMGRVTFAQCRGGRPSLIGGSTCGGREYLQCFSTPDDGTCTACTSCGAGEFAEVPCGRWRDAVCKACPLGTVPGDGGTVCRAPTAPLPPLRLMPSPMLAAVSVLFGLAALLAVVEGVAAWRRHAPVQRLGGGRLHAVVGVCSPGGSSDATARKQGAAAEAAAPTTPVWGSRAPHSAHRDALRPTLPAALARVPSLEAWSDELASSPAAAGSDVGGGVRAAAAGGAAACSPFVRVVLPSLAMLWAGAMLGTVASAMLYRLRVEPDGAAQRANEELMKASQHTAEAALATLLLGSSAVALAGALARRIVGAPLLPVPRTPSGVRALLLPQLWVLVLALLRPAALQPSAGAPLSPRDVRRAREPALLLLAMCFLQDSSLTGLAAMLLHSAAGRSLPLEGTAAMALLTLVFTCCAVQDVVWAARLSCARTGANVGSGEPEPRAGDGDGTVVVESAVFWTKATALAGGDGAGAGLQSVTLARAHAAAAAAAPPQRVVDSGGSGGAVEGDARASGRASAGGGGSAAAGEPARSTGVAGGGDDQGAASASLPAAQPPAVGAAGAAGDAAGAGMTPIEVDNAVREVWARSASQEGRVLVFLISYLRSTPRVRALLQARLPELLVVVQLSPLPPEWTEILKALESAASVLSSAEVDGGGAGSGGSDDGGLAASGAGSLAGSERSHLTLSELSYDEREPVELHADERRRP